MPTALALRATEQRRGSLGALGAAGLLLAVAVCGAPVLLPLAVVVLLASALVVRRHRRYLLVAPLPALAVGAPFWVHVASTWSDGGWRLLLAEPGAPQVPVGSPDGLELLVGLPGDAAGTGGWFARWLGDAGGLAGLVGAYGPWLPGAFVLVLATVALLRARGAGGVRLAWFGAALGLAAAILAVATTVAGAPGPDGEPAPVTGWPGAGQSVLLLGLGAAALHAVDRSHRRPDVVDPHAADPHAEARTPADGDAEPAWPVRLRGAAWGALAATALLLPAATATSWALHATSGEQGRVAALRAEAEPLVPAVGQQVQAPPRAATVLQLDRGDDAVVGYTLLHADGSRLQDSSTVVHARAAGLLAAPDRPATGLLRAVVADLVVGTAPDLAERLAQLGVGAVQVPPGGDPELVTTLDLVSGLTRVTEDGARVWRVQPDGPPSGWATVLSAAPTPDAPHDAVATLAADGVEARGRLDPEGPEGRTLVLAAAADAGWTATVDGRRAPAVEAGGLQAFAVGPDGGRVHVWYDSPHRGAWLTGAGVVVLVFALLALPVGRRRGRVA